MKRHTTISTSVATTNSRNGNGIFCSSFGRNIGIDTGDGLFEKK